MIPPPPCASSEVSKALDALLGVLLGVAAAILTKALNVDAWAVSRVRPLIKRLLGKKGFRNLSAEFMLGDERCFTCVIEGNGLSKIEVDNFAINYTDLFYDFEQGIKEGASQVEALEAAKAAAGQHASWNGPMAHMKAFRVERSMDGKELAGVTIEACKAHYFEYIATTAAYENQVHKCQRQRTSIESVRWREQCVPGRVNGLPVNIFIMTSDRYIIFSRRSNNVAIAPGQLSATVNENIHPAADLENGRLSLVKAAMRGIREELGWLGNKPGEIDTSMDELAILSFFVGTDTGSYGTGIMYRSSCNLAELRNHYHALAKDRFETAELVAVRLSLPELSKFIERNRLYNVVGVLAIYILLHTTNTTYPTVQNTFRRLQSERKAPTG